jgi:hypothetical membrane protein
MECALGENMGAMLTYGRDIRAAGALSFIAGVQGILLVTVAEALYPNYSINKNYLSDLGATCSTTPCMIVQPSSIIFDSTLILQGLLSMMAAYFFYRATKAKAFTLLFGLYGFGTLIAGVFPETTIIVHELGALVAFICGSVSAIVSIRFLDKSPLRYVSIALGALALSALVPVVLSGTFMRLNNEFGLGIGGMERLIAYPIIIWELGFAGFLLGQSEKKLAKSSEG